MKKLVKITSLALCLMLTLTACSAVFDSAISGTVKDRSVRETSSTSSGAIADVMVYAYDNEDDWNNKYNAWVKNGGNTEFSDNSVPSAKTAADGSFSIANLRWLTNSPAYGKDADSRTIYLLAFHKDYGLVKVAGRTIQSDKSNNFGIVYMDKVTATKTLVIKLKDTEDNSTTATGNDSTISNTSGISFKYKYADGYDGENQNVSATVDSFTNGQATITVKYKDGGNVPKVTLYDIQTGSDWKLVDEDTVTIDCEYDTQKKEYKNTSITLESKWKTVTVTVSLIDGSSSDLSSVTDPIYFKWSYNNGDDSALKTGNETTSTGSSTITVKYKKGTDPKLTLTAFDDNDTSDDKWTWTTSEDNATAHGTSDPVTVDLVNNDRDKDNVTQKIYFRKNYIKLSTSGISGYLLTPDDASVSGATKATGYGWNCDQNDEVLLYNADGDKLNKNTVRTSYNVVSSTDPAIIDYGRFTGLGSGAKLKITYTGDSYDGTVEPLTVKYIKRGDASRTEIEAETLNSYTAKTTDFTVTLYK